MATYQEQIERNRLAREAKEKAEAERKASQLSPDQVEHWRDALANMGIPFARSMPAEMIQKFRDRIQASISAQSAIQPSTKEKS